MEYLNNILPFILAGGIIYMSFRDLALHQAKKESYVPGDTVEYVEGYYRKKKVVY